ncbi:MAG: cobalamin-independent methionine synthase II family protein, partial [Candidatus Dormibacteraeota bacterium]|nr:cobalamin-independent methionine synthase II family protein [Candidatus Dormibacteraeota bacterium]
MLTATKDLLLPTTVTGSWPRPSWFDANLFERPFSTGMADLRYREQFVDAVSCVLADQEAAGLDILTDGDYHLDHDLAGRSWFSYPTERLSGVSEYDVETTDEWSYPVGTWLNEIVGGWKYHAVLDKIGPRAPLEFAKIWRVAQARANRPVKFGTVSPDIATSVLKLHTNAYSDKQQVMWDLAGIMNQELRALAAAGCPVIQIEEPAIHSQAAFGASKETLDFLVDLFNHTVEGLEGTELWIHTCWGNPGAQNCFPPSVSYEPSMEIYLNRLKGDVWTIESKENDHRLLPAFAAYKGRLPKKIAVGFISHRQLQVETADEVAGDVRRALEYIDAEQLILSSDCGFGRQGVPRPIAFYKA